MAGGITKNPLWLEATIDAIGRRADVAENSNLTLHGAAVQAAVATGDFTTHDEAATALMPPMTSLAPDPERHARYVDMLADYREAAEALTPILLPVPAIVGEALTREVLERDRIVLTALSQARAAQAHVFSFGVANHDSILVSSGNVLEDEMDNLIQGGAVGDVLGRFIDDDGAIVDPDLDARTVGLALQDLREARWRIGVTSGVSKHRVTRAVLKAGFINTLITDEDTARYLLEEGNGNRDTR